VLFTALTWNLFHGRDRAPDPTLHTVRSRLLRTPKRNDTHIQVNRDLLPEFTRVLLSADWDVALLQECPPRWADALAEAAGGDHHMALTSRNSFPRLRARLADFNPDLIGSNEGGSNLILLRRGTPLGRITERRELVLHEGPPERRVMAFARTSSGLCVANLHATVRNPAKSGEEALNAATTSTSWAGDDPLLFGGDFNASPARAPDLFQRLADEHVLAPPTSEKAIDHLLARGLEVIDHPAAWPGRRREVTEDGLALRLSDHSPVQATFESPG
jgi:endonuclease/exonuclease/phosphatase family metal-dependent hydrolase